MAVVAAELDLDQRWPLACAGAFDGRARSLVHGKEIEAVDGHAGHAEAGGAVGDVVAGHRPVRGGGLGVAVVLGDEDARQVHDRGHVHGLEHRAFVGGTVAEERHRNVVAALELGGQGGPGHQRRSGADDTVGAKHAFFQVGDVHRAALAAAHAGLLAVDLGHHAVHIDALGDAVAVATVGRGNAVAVAQVGHDPGGGGFFAGIKVDEAGDLAGGELHVQAFLERTDGAHHFIGMQQLFSAQVSGHLVVLQGCLNTGLQGVTGGRAGRPAGGGVRRGPARPRRPRSAGLGGRG
ncbi:hypothetical protein D3C81_1306790 [compost metagenome]